MPNSSHRVRLLRIRHSQSYCLATQLHHTTKSRSLLSGPQSLTRGIPLHFSHAFQCSIPQTLYQQSPIFFLFLLLLLLILLLIPKDTHQNRHQLRHLPPIIHNLRPHLHPPPFLPTPFPPLPPTLLRIPPPQAHRRAASPYGNLRLRALPALDLDRLHLRPCLRRASPGFLKLRRAQAPASATESAHGFLQEDPGGREREEAEDSEGAGRGRRGRVYGGGEEAEEGGDGGSGAVCAV